MRQLIGLFVLIGVASVTIESAFAQPGRGGRGGGAPGGGYRGGPPGGGDRGGMRGGAPGGGGDRGGMRGGAPGGSYRGGPPGGSDQGGAPRGDFTERMFSGMAKGGDVIERSKLDARGQDMLDRMGIKGERVTKEQFKSGFDKLRQSFNPGGGPPPSSSSGNSSSASSSKEDDAKKERERAEYYFRRRDANKDGFLDASEMSDSLKQDLKKWDKNRDGKISLDEFIPYVKDFNDKRSSDRKTQSDDKKKDEKSVERVRPEVYYYGNLPKNIPTWFTEDDLDMDGQIGLYEWIPSERPISEFEAMDLNGDGFLTPTEVMTYMEAQEAEKEKDSSSSRSRR